MPQLISFTQISGTQNGLILMVNANLKRFYIFLAVLMASSFLIVNFIGPKVMRTNMIDGDGAGHYAYLPAVFIYHSLDFTPVFEFEKNRRSLDYRGHYFHNYEDKLINKYSSGTALLQLPFFLLAWLISVMAGFDADGYTIFFQYGVALSAVSSVFLGLIFLFRLLQLYSVKTWVIYVTLVVGLVGTNLFYYTFYAPSMSHAYSFGLISMFLFYVSSSFKSYTKSAIWKSAFLLGLIVLVRPVNIIVVLCIPFLASSASNFLMTVKLKIRKMDFIPAIFLFLLAISPQLIINYLQTGQVVFFSYEGEGFYFTRPEFIKFLFSYRKGWFVYTPIMLLIIPAIVILYRRSKYMFWSALLSTTIIIYVFASWWNWFYGNSFGMRPMVDFYAYFLLLIALMFNHVKHVWMKSITLIAASFAIFLNLVQSSQYLKGIIHPDAMNRDAYWYVFLKTDDTYKNSVSYTDEYFYGKLSESPFLTTTLTLEKASEGWAVNRGITKEKDSLIVSHLDATNLFSPTYHYLIPEEWEASKNLYVIFNADYFEYNEDAALGALFVVAINDESKELSFYKTFRLKRLPSADTLIWNEGSIGFKLPEISPTMRKASFYIWNNGRQKIDIANLKLSFYRYHP